MPLPSRFSRIKRALLGGHADADALEASWTRLLVALRADVEHIDGLGAHLIPSIEFADLEDHGQTARFRGDLRRYGVGVVRKVVPRGEAEAALRETVRYIDGQKTTDGGKVAEELDPACYNLFWSPGQMNMRAHPNVRKAQQFMMSLWDTEAEEQDDGGQVAAQHPIAYADRIRVYGAHDSIQKQNSDEHRTQTDVASRATARSPAAPAPQSADDWITALASSDGIIAQVDNGSLERWEPDGYQRAGTYASVFRGAWETHDPWCSARRAAATTDLYNGHGACSVFRMFQGVLALSVVEPGMIRLLPSPRAAAAYYLLRPFFAPRVGLPLDMERRTEEEQAHAWEAYLAPENWELRREPDTVIHGSVPGHAQRVTERWHPHLRLRRSMITLPTLQPGDYILWHPDLPYHISPGEANLPTPPPPPPSQPPASEHDTLQNLRMLVYIPAAPLTPTSALYLARQRKAFQRGQPAPDFDSSGRRSGQPAERQDVVAAEEAVERVGGRDALRAMGLAPWDTSALVTRPSTPSHVAMAGANGGARGNNTAGAGGAERGKASEVVRLANIILFPETSLLG